MKTIRAKTLALNYNPTGERMVWRFWREPSVYGNGKRSPYWAWEDETGYKRYGPSTWAEFVPYLRGYFQSYNCTPLHDFN